MAENAVIVIGGDHHNMLGVIRSVGRTGRRVSAIVLAAGRRSYVTMSRYIETWKQIDDINDLIPTMLEIASGKAPKPVVICCHDGMAAILNDNRTLLSAKMIIPGGEEEGRLNLLMDKVIMNELALSCGLDVPESDVFPCIVKPRKSCAGEKDWIQVVSTEDDLNSCIERHGKDKLLIQRYIDAVAEYQLIGCALPDGNVIIPGVSSILRPCKGSNTSFLRYSGPDTVVDSAKVRDFVRKTGYQGLFSVEFVRDADGKDYFLEINFRNDGNAICVTKAGVNLPLIWILGSIGRDYSAEAAKRVKTVYVMPEFDELSLLTSHIISFRDYLGDLLKTNAGMEFDFRDQRPFWYQLKRRIIHKASSDGSI